MCALINVFKLRRYHPESYIGMAARVYQRSLVSDWSPPGAQTAPRRGAVQSVRSH
jgi:hypothetical protein